MPLELMLLRHAKSNRDDPMIPDIDRPITPKGKKAAAQIGAYMVRNNLAPSLVLCSPALRTRETWDVISFQLKSNQSAIICPELYNFGDHNSLLECVRNRGSVATCVLLIGHNPSIQDFARCLSGTGEKSLVRNLEEKYPTAALCGLSFAMVEWSKIALGQGKLEFFVSPKDFKYR
jgi:phosphohistidine phosphatase